MPKKKKKVLLSINLPNATDPSDIADWAELYILLKQESLSKTTMVTKIYGEGGEDPAEGLIESVWQELEYRSSLYGKKQPFSLDQQRIQPLIAAKQRPDYLFFLLLSLFGNSEATQTTLTGKLFERISETAVKEYFKGDSIVYGHPSPISMKELAAKLSEEFLCEPGTDANDDGVDIIAWQTPGDGRPGQLVALIQCASGFNWRTKTLSIPMVTWSYFIKWGCQLTKGFTVPIVIPRDKFLRISQEAGFLFDRPRLFRRITANKASEDELRKEILKWCNKETLRQYGIKIL